jgi:very-short-patch-repair endonuclease
MATGYRAGRLGVDHLGRCRTLRHQITDAERALWRRLRDRQLGGAKFRRQHEFGPYVLDFYCQERCLVVEVDGGQHYEPEQAARDERRTVYLASQGLRVLRFSNLDVLRNLEGVLGVVWGAVVGETGPHPNPLPEGEGANASSQ